VAATVVADSTYFMASQLLFSSSLIRNALIVAATSKIQLSNSTTIRKCHDRGGNVENTVQ